MKDDFSIISLKQLAELIKHQLNNRNSIFGYPTSVFYNASENTSYKVQRYSTLLENPLGVAAGPQTQLAQNIIISWLMGARYIELKTIQTLDELTVSKPCIDMQDEGYNCEWSQELKIHESVDQYLNAWIMIHVLKHILKHREKEPGFIFNMSIGYDLKGILDDKVQWFLDQMQDASVLLKSKIKEISSVFPEIKKLHINPVLSDNVTLSTMHGCPPQEIEKIAAYLLEERKLHTTVKLNPTLLGKSEVKDLIKRSGFNAEIPDVAFEHDLRFEDAIPILDRLQQVANKEDLEFSVKLCNTLESLNNKKTFSPEERHMYLSGRALHPIAVNLASKIVGATAFPIDISFSGGVDMYNVAETVQAGLYPVTICSDLLKPGGYGRLKQYIEKLDASFINKPLPTGSDRYHQLENYAESTRDSIRYQKTIPGEKSIKIARKLHKFDCIQAPCSQTCPSNQDIPSYMHFTATDDLDSAFKVIMQTNPFPGTTGMVCDHACQYKCTRSDYDEALYIRAIKGFVTKHTTKGTESSDPKTISTKKLAIIGAGPAGLSCAYFAAIAGLHVEVFEAGSEPGGMINRVIPKFRIDGEILELDVERIKCLGVKVKLNHPIDKKEFDKLREQFDFVFIGTGAHQVKTLKIKGLPSNSVLDALNFLDAIKQGENPDIGQHILIIGGGNTAMDLARTCMRLLKHSNGKVSLVYRRTINQMPAEWGEIKDALQEGVQLLELLNPVELLYEGDKMFGVKCQKMKLGPEEKDGRQGIIPIEGEYEAIKADTIIPAIGQEAVVNFADTSDLKNKENSMETQIPGVYIGGDASRGASTIIKAINDGKISALEILEKAGINFQPDPISKDTDKNYEDHFKKRISREYSPISPPKMLENPGNFSLIADDFSKDIAIEEAERCLLCDEFCSICTLVCPNLALQTYPSILKEYKSYQLISENGSVKVSENPSFKLKDKWQVLHIPDWCNSCGNCNTFCPTSGAPYLSKPHVHFNRENWEKERKGYFIYSNNIFTYINDEFYALKDDNDRWKFENPYYKAWFKKENFKLVEYEVIQNGFETNTSTAIEMSLILKGSQELFGKDMFK